MDAFDAVDAGPSQGPPRYAILGVVGRGGFGTVYRARMRGPGGFVKDVAIKLLHDEGTGSVQLARFRDEARILGLLRDPAVVSVDPPTRLDGRWAVIMDYVDGLSCAEYLRTQGAFPPGIALQIVGEVARCLDHSHRFPGPDGRPLGLLHRDIKPHNIQITPAGGVRVLDFGVARASFDGRETHSTIGMLTGTPGYMAPERRAGIETPAGDVYSLGVVLWALLTREPPKGDPTPGELQKLAAALVKRSPELRDALELAVRMRASDPAKRPSPRDVERRAREIVQEQRSPWLRDWAESLPGRPLETDDPLVGRELAPDPPAPAEAPAAAGVPWLVVGLAVFAMFMAGVAAVSLLALLAVLASS
ncbi:MAG: serine/threonine protein kinase [Alphaproteobacteria bacterium]|nr:serine/threonine protein kinase [Alphaproteobacteria bacterium]